MNNVAPVVVVALLGCLGLTGCINPLPGAGAIKGDRSEAAAMALLEASAEAHGGDERFAEVRRIEVAYDGQWLNNVWKLQPELVDRGYRQSSVEMIAFGEGWPRVEQTHTGPAGEKLVAWPAGDREVVEGGAWVDYRPKPGVDQAAWRGGPEVESAENQEAAAMVAEAYRMFLTGPFYFTQRRGMAIPRLSEGDGVVVVMSEPDVVDGVACEQVLVRLRPGFGVSEEDRVQVAIGRDDRLVRRVRFSLEGYRGTRGATADVVLAGFETVEGLVFPTEFLEIVTHPIDREVHRWTAERIEVGFEEQ
jgi:hypothetical protein